MENELIPILLSGAAVVFGLIALLMGLMGKLAAQRLVRDVETVRQQALQAVSSQWIRDRELETQLAQHVEAHEIIQRFKERLSDLTGAPAGRFDAASGVDHVAGGGRQMAAAVERLVPRLTGRERDELTRAGDLAVAAAAEVRGLLKAVPDPAQLGRAEREAIVRIRVELSECQQVFRDVMITALIKRSSDQEQPAA